MSSSMFNSVSNSSRSSVGPSSTASHKINRGLAKLALDSANLSMGVNLELEKGDIYETLQLGNDEKKALNEPRGFALVRINYCQRGLQELGAHLTIQKLSEDSGQSEVSQAQAEKVKQIRGLINHDYLVLELQKGRSGEMFYILAHKLGGSRRVGSSTSSGAGIYISSILADDLQYILHKGVQLHVINCGKKFIPLDKLLHLLQTEDPDYSLRNNNCWDYATATTKRLVMACIHVEGTDRPEEARLKKEHDDLEANLNKNQMQSTAKILLKKTTKMLSS